MKIMPSKEIVICTEAEQKTSSGLDLGEVEKDKDRPTVGKVYAIGEGELPLKIAVGDTVIFRHYTENRVFLDAEEFNFIRFEDVVGVVKKGEKG